MSQDFNIATHILEAARRYPDRVAFRMPHPTVTFRQFEEMILSHAFHMRALGIGRSSRVCIIGAGPVAQVCTALACALLGCSWVTGRLAAAETNLGITHVIHTDTKAAPIAGKFFRVEQSWFSPQPVAEKDFEGFASPDAIWFLAHSSGTTGATKYMAISAAAQLRRLADNPFDYLGDTPPVVCSLMPFLSVYGMEYVFKALMMGGTVVRTKDLIAMISAGVTTAVGSPAQYLPVLERSSPLRKKMSCAVIGGAHCSDQFFDRMLERFEMVQHQFGCSELGRISFNRFGPGAENRNSVGKPRPGAEVRIFDADGHTLPATSTGSVGMRSSGSISGYVGGSDAETFRDGWFFSGDIGYLSETGELTITGRADDLINIGGAKLNANALDEVIAATDGVEEGVCFLQRGDSGAEELAILIVPAQKDEAKAVADRVMANLTAKFRAAGNARRVYVVSAIPKSENGKIARHTLPQFVTKTQPLQIRVMKGAASADP